MPDPNAARVVNRTAKLNVAGAILLVAIKLGVGLASGSLGFLAEAAHSATDLVAALLTLYAVRVALRPPDRHHHYGHGKAEYLAALGESAFLLLVSVFIGYESVDRLVSDGGAGLEPQWWAFTALAVVIAIDIARMLSSRAVARRHNSPALAANTLHFASDFAGSLAVLVGLVLVSSGVKEADAIAALFVAALVIVAALRLAIRSSGVLMDRASVDAEEKILHALEGLAGVEVRRLRVRHAAGANFADLVVAVAPDAGLSQAHATADQIEQRIEAALSHTDVVVHVEPQLADASLRERATAAAAAVPEAREIHNVRVLNIDGTRELSLHVKLPRHLTLTDAHDAVERLERSILAQVPEIVRVHTHIEPLSQTRSASNSAGVQAATDRAAIEAVVHELTDAPPLSLELRDSGTGRIALVTITVAGDMALPDAHRLAGDVEAEIERRCPELEDAVIHTEPRAS
ncbi:MAG TPA: cation diffusion facilitator family transporter [Baekduia sp.]|nr:cation diffusion facilitator family transporter [Baekduia sp.]